MPIPTGMATVIQFGCNWTSREQGVDSSYPVQLLNGRTKLEGIADASNQLQIADQKSSLKGLRRFRYSRIESSYVLSSPDCVRRKKWHQAHWRRVSANISLTAQRWAFTGILRPPTTEPNHPLIGSPPDAKIPSSVHGLRGHEERVDRTSTRWIFFKARKKKIEPIWPPAPLLRYFRLLYCSSERSLFHLLSYYQIS